MARSNGRDLGSQLEEEMSVLFREEQKLPAWSIWLVTAALVGAIAAFGLGMHHQLVQGKPWGNKPMSDSMLKISATFVILASFASWFMVAKAKLVTEVRRDGLHVRFFPFHLKYRVFPWAGIKSMEAVTYRPLLDYGGWGIRYGRKGRAWNARGNRGIMLNFVKDKPLLVGSQDPDKILSASPNFRN